ncbi:MAG: lasso peptide biosynthesis B2 protein [Deltaproteobacteria bacterium]|jgi:hypothetical protein|nr:lasso peptide biosynthesis B2 protein [Deltaproteobacteria bacterium]
MIRGFKLFFKFIKKPLTTKILLLKVTILLAFWRLMILVAPFKKMTPYLGTQMKASEDQVDENIFPRILLIATAIQAMSRHLPWECKCLVQAMTGKSMLRQQSIECTIYFGLAKDEHQKLLAHAWLRVGEEVVLGKAGMEDYTIVSYFT